MDGDGPAGGLDLADLVERHLLGGGRVYTRLDVAERSGLTLDQLRALWRSLGFATVGDDDRVFTDADLRALQDVVGLRDVGALDEDSMRAVARIIGQSFARLASWQGQLVTDIFARTPDLLADGTGERLTALMDELTPLVAHLHEYVWRRQLAAYLSRVVTNELPAGVAGGARASAAESAAAVGFVDMAGFTTFTRRSTESELRAVLGAFETLTTETVGAHRGQIIKTIGDEVLFAAEDPRAGARIALDLVAAADADDLLPQVRAGVAFGPVVSRLGDVFGQTVNIASRLTSIARANSVLVDEGLAAQLAGDDGFSLHALRPASVRGYHHLRSWRLRRPTA